MIPIITPGQMQEVVRRHLPSADIKVESINPEYQSWTLTVATPRSELEFVWGPLTGFGVCDDSIENENPFAPFDFAFDSLQAAEAYILKHLHHVA